MDIKQLIKIVKKKIKKQIVLEDIKIEDKSFLHKNHNSHEKNKFHIKLIIKSEQLKAQSKIQATKEIYKILDYELKKHIHSIQILIN